MNTDVAIIGGGLTGLMMARALSVTGVSICLLDRSAGDHGMADDRTTTIHAAGMRMLDTLGISDHLPDAATPIMRIAVAEGAPLTGLAARRRPDSDLSWQASEDPLAYVVRNADLQAALMAALASTISPASSASTSPSAALPTFRSSRPPARRSRRRMSIRSAACARWCRATTT